MDFDLTGILAVGGFWLVVLVAILKGPITKYLETKTPTDSAEVKALNERITHLEAMIASMSKEMLELKDTTEFAHKLLTDSSREVSNLNKSLAEGGLLEGKSQETKTPESSSPGKIKLVTTDGVKVEAPENAGEILSEHTIRFERIIDAKPDKVWQYLTQSKFIGEWLDKGSIEPKIGGKVDLTFNQNEVEGLVGWYEDERGLSYSFVDKKNGVESIVAIELTPVGDKTKLVLKHSRLPRKLMADFMASWHAHLDILVAKISRIAPPEFRKRFMQLLPFYTALVLAFVAPIAAQASGDNGTYQALSAERNRLLQKYDDLRRDTENIQKKMDTLKRDDSKEAERACDQLDDALKQDYRLMKELEGQIRDFDNALR